MRKTVLTRLKKKLNRYKLSEETQKHQHYQVLFNMDKTETREALLEQGKLSSEVVEEFICYIEEDL